MNLYPVFPIVNESRSSKLVHEDIISGRGGYCHLGEGSVQDTMSDVAVICQVCAAAALS